MRGLKSGQAVRVYLLGRVAPFAGAWIEIRNGNSRCHAGRWVAPFAGAWIEMFKYDGDYIFASVAPFAGAWIEISIADAVILTKLSHPSRVRGLKSTSACYGSRKSHVAPFAGAWIEII